MRLSKIASAGAPVTSPSMISFVSAGTTFRYPLVNPIVAGMRTTFPALSTFFATKSTSFDAHLAAGEAPLDPITIDTSASELYVMLERSFFFQPSFA